MDERLKFVARRLAGEPMSELCREFGDFSAPDEMRQIIGSVSGQWRALFATLATTGLRCEEAFGLHIDDLDLASGRIFVRGSVWNGQEVTTKTKAGVRAIDIEPALVSLLSGHLAGRTAGRVFQTRAGTPFSKGNVRRKLREVLTKLNLPMGGLHAFRHGRVSFHAISLRQFCRGLRTSRQR